MKSLQARGNGSVSLPGGFDQFVEFAPDAIVGIDAEGRIAIANAQTEALFGYARAELLGQTLEVLVPERFRAAHPRYRKGYFGDPRTRPMGAKLELFGRRRDGSEFPAEISLSSIETDDGLLAIAAVRDVSERDRARRQFEQFLEFAPDAIVGVGRSGDILLVNAQTEAVFGYARTELLGRSVETLVPERWHDIHPSHRTGYFTDPRTRPMGAELELFGRRRDGSEFPAEISLSSIETDDGLLAIAAIRDITERRALETQLERSRRLESQHEKEALEAQLNQLRRLESVGQLAGGIAHDFNNLLGVILNYADFVAGSLDADSPALEDVGEIRRAAERGAALTRQLLIFSRREVVHPQVLDIGQVVGDLDKLLRRALGEHISFTTHFAPDLWPIEIDLGQFEQVLVNLAVNARDAMPDGGRLILETANVELDETYREIEHQIVPGSYVRLTVSDTGDGMEPEVAKRAFEPFFSTKPRGQGTGLGLTTVYGIVTEAGGNLHIYSGPGVGTTVKVHLPASSGTPTPLQPSPSRAPDGRGETVLVVEDEDGVRRLTERILTNAGYRVLTAPSGTKALEICARDEPIDLLLTDVVMPEMLGPEVARRVTSIRPQIKVLFMSGYVHQAIGGADPGLAEDIVFIEKPFNAETLLKGVRAALDSAVAD